MSRIGYLFIAIALVWTITGCGSEDGGDDKACATNTTQKCDCAENTQGVQECKEDGSGYTQCDCSGTDGADATDATDATDGADATDGGDGNQGPAPCSPESQGISGTAVEYKMVPMPAGCETTFDEQTDPALPTVSFAISAEELLAVFNCNGATPDIDVDFSKSRVAIIQGVHEHDSNKSQTLWVIESNGAITVDLTFDGYCSGMAPGPIPYISMVALPVGDTPVSGKICYLPSDEFCSQLP